MTSKVCSTCKKEYPAENYVGFNGKPTKQCEKCRAEGKKAQEQRRARPGYNAVRSFNRRKRYHEDTLHREEWKQQVKKYKKEHPAMTEKHKLSGRGYLSNYKTGAKSRNLEWGLTHDEALKMICHQNCFYCNSAPNPLNGIDRVNNSMSYVIDNCVSCCKTCNFAKGEWSAPSFVSMCGHIATANGLNGGPLNFDLFPHVQACNLYTYKQNALSRNIAFEIDAHMYESITSNPCAYCKKPNSKTHKNGLDRINNEPVYSPETIISCCGTCNMLKKTSTKEEFINQCFVVWNNCNTKIDIVTRTEKQKRPKQNV